MMVLKIIKQCWLSHRHKRKAKVTPTHVMTSFRDSIAFSSVILSGLSSDVCFFMSAMVEERESKKQKPVRSRQAGRDENHVEKDE